MFSDAASAAVSPWEVMFPGPGRLPHLTSLMLRYVSPEPQQAVEWLVTYRSSLRQLQLDSVTDEQCSSLVQLTGLRELQVTAPRHLSAAGLRLLARLEQLTSLGFGCHFDSRKVSTELQEQLSDTVLGCRHALVNKVGACLLGGRVWWWWLNLVTHVGVNHTDLPPRGVWKPCS